MLAYAKRGFPYLNLRHGPANGGDVRGLRVPEKRQAIDSDVDPFRGSPDRQDEDLRLPRNATVLVLDRRERVVIKTEGTR